MIYGVALDYALEMKSSEGDGHVADDYTSIYTYLYMYTYIYIYIYISLSIYSFVERECVISLRGYRSCLRQIVIMP